MRRRGCLFGCSGTVLVIIVLCGLLYLVGLPKVQDRLRDSLANELSTQVSRQIDTQISGVKLQPGEYRLSLQELQQQLNANNDNNQISGFDIYGDGEAIVLQLRTSGQNLEYRGVPEILDGQLRMTGMTSTSGALDFFLPPDKLGQAIDRSVNSYIDAQGMTLQDVRIEANDLVFDVAQ